MFGVMYWTLILLFKTFKSSFFQKCSFIAKAELSCFSPGVLMSVTFFGWNTSGGV